jgi:hypothetical protein
MKDIYQKNFPQLVEAAKSVFMEILDRNFIKNLGILQLSPLDYEVNGLRKTIQYQRVNQQKVNHQETTKTFLARK